MFLESLLELCKEIAGDEQIRVDVDIHNVKAHWNRVVMDQIGMSLACVVSYYADVLC